MKNRFDKSTRYIQDERAHGGGACREGVGQKAELTVQADHHSFRPPHASWGDLVVCGGRV